MSGPGGIRGGGKLARELGVALGGVPAGASDDLGGLDALGPAVLDEPDALDAFDTAAPAGQVNLPRSLDAVLAAPSADVAARALDLGGMTAALAAVVRRGARPGESEREKRMRELCARYLDLLQEAAAAMARISVG